MVGNWGGRCVVSIGVGKTGVKGHVVTWSDLSVSWNVSISEDFVLWVSSVQMVIESASVSTMRCSVSVESRSEVSIVVGTIGVRTVVGTIGVWTVIGTVWVDVMSGVTVVVDIVDVCFVRSIWDQIVVRIVIIWDENTAIFVAGNLDLVGVDFAHWSNDGLSVNLEHDLIVRDGGSSELWVSAWSNLNISRGSLLDVDTVRRVGVVVRLGLVNLWLWLVDGLRLGLVGLLGLDVCVNVWLGLGSNILGLSWHGRSVRSIEVESVGKSLLTASDNVLAWADHLWGKGKLLAVKNKSGFVVVKGLLAVVAVVLKTGNASKLRVELLDESLHVFIDIVLVGSDLLALVVDMVLEFLEIITKVHGRLLQRLKSNKHLSFNLDTFGIVVLIPNGFVVVELVDMSVEVSTWESFLVFVLVAGLNIAWVVVVCITLIRSSVIVVDVSVTWGGISLRLERHCL